MRVETTVRVFRDDALVLRQLQSFLELHEKNMTQAEFVHAAMRFLLEHHDAFLQEVEREGMRNERVLEEWMKVLLKRMEAENRI